MAILRKRSSPYDLNLLTPDDSVIQLTRVWVSRFIRHEILLWLTFGAWSLSADTKYKFECRL